MPVRTPYTHKPEDIGKLLTRLPGIEVPANAIDAGFFQKLGFTASSSRHLFDILKKIGFIDEKDRASATWLAFAADEKRGLVLASAIKQAYAGLFKLVLCPYLEDDERLIDYFELDEKASGKELSLAVQTFRALCDLADFQDVLCEEGPGQTKPAVPEMPLAVKVNPNLQITVQVHIDPATSDEKIEVIFKNMRKYLLGQEG
jgi:hypothetical protein